MGCNHAWTQTSLSEDRTRRRRAAAASRQERDVALVPGAACADPARECGRGTNPGVGRASRVRPGHRLAYLPPVRDLRSRWHPGPCPALRFSGAHFPLWSGHESSSWPVSSPSPVGSTSHTGRARTWPGKQCVKGSSGASARARSGGSSPPSISSRTAPDTGGAPKQMPSSRRERRRCSGATPTLLASQRKASGLSLRMRCPTGRSSRGGPFAAPSPAGGSL